MHALLKYFRKFHKDRKEQFSNSHTIFATQNKSLEETTSKLIYTQNNYCSKAFMGF